jgi:hypothetical protein
MGRQVDFEIDADRALENNLMRIEPRPLSVVVNQEGLVRPDARELHGGPPRLLEHRLAAQGVGCRVDVHVVVVR